MASTPQRYGAFDRLWTDISDVLDPAYRREECLRNFLRDLHHSAVTMNDFEAVVRRLPTGAAFGKGDILPGAAELYASLSDSEKAQLREHYFAKVKDIEQEFPELKLEFPTLFARRASPA